MVCYIILCPVILPIHEGRAFFFFGLLLWSSGNFLSCGWARLGRVASSAEVQSWLQSVILLYKMEEPGCSFVQSSLASLQLWAATAVEKKESRRRETVAAAGGERVRNKGQQSLYSWAKFILRDMQTNLICLSVVYSHAPDISHSLQIKNFNWCGNSVTNKQQQ